MLKSKCELTSDLLRKLRAPIYLSSINYNVFGLFSCARVDRPANGSARWSFKATGAWSKVC